MAEFWNPTRHPTPKVTVLFNGIARPAGQVTVPEPSSDGEVIEAEPADDRAAPA